MRGTAYKKYTDKARRGIKGEACFESLIVEHAIPHRIARQNDLGVDFLCEWAHGDRPCGILFLAQVKSTTAVAAKPARNTTPSNNGLDTYTLSGAKPVGERTINYWKGLGLPTYLFVVVEDGSGGASHQDCYYKRYTPRLDGHASPDDRKATKLFYRVNNGATFVAFGQNGGGGFARDLMIDYVRMNCWKGSIVPVRPGDFGVDSLNGNEDIRIVFDEIVGWHRDRIKETWELTGRILSRLVATTGQGSSSRSR